MPILGVLVFLLGLALIFFQGVFAYSDFYFTASEMMERHGRGLPMFWHFGIMWGDIMISLLCGLIVGAYADQWSLKQIAVVAGVALVLSAVMHYQYLHDPIPNSHMHGGHLTPPAYVHLFFMWMAMTIIGLFFLCTEGTSVSTVITVALLLWVHVVLGTHLLVKIWSPAWFPPQPIADGVTLAVWGGAAIALGALSWWTVHEL